MAKGKREAAAGPFAQHTPLMRQYLGFKEQVGSMLLFFRVGDFYELFWEDAREASRLLDLAVAKRGESGGRPVEMAGVPWHALDIHLGRLSKMGKSAAVVDQVGDPAKAVGPVERKLSRIVTPGTLMDEALLERKAEASFAALFAQGGRAGIFWMAPSSGEARWCELPAAEIADELERLAPSEILAPEGFAFEREGVASASLPAWRFDAKKGERDLLEHFGASSLEAFGLEGKALALSALCAGYSHAKACAGGERPNLQELREERLDGMLRMGAETRRALEILSTQRGEAEPTLASCMDRCFSHMGSRRLRAWLASPSASAKGASERHEAVEALLGIPEGMERFGSILGELIDLERAASRAASQSARPRDFAGIRSFLERIGSLKEALGPAAGESSLVSGLLLEARGSGEALAFLRDCVAEEVPARINDGGFVREGFSAELDEARDLAGGARRLVAELEAREREATGIPNLRVEFSRAHGFLIEVSKGQAGKAPAHYRRRQTLKGAERYTTDELEALEQKALSAQERAGGLEREIYEQAQARLAGWAPGILASAKAVAALDALCSFARVALERGYVRPEIGEEEARFEAEGLRHPVAELAVESYQPNSVRLSAAERSLLVTGPNMGGKSTLMRSAALAVILAQAGSFVPASSCRIGAFSRVFARVGAGDDIARGKSTFMVEMEEAAAILRQADGRSLALIDEIGRGTSTYDGIALAWAILRHLHEDNKALTLFSTHYFELTEMAASLEGARNAHMDATFGPGGEILFAHRLLEGPASKSHGVAVARMAGIPAKALVWAREQLSRMQSAPGAPSPGEPGAAPAAPESAIEAALEELDPDRMTPREALEALYALKGIAAEGGGKRDGIDEGEPRGR